MMATISDKQLSTLSKLLLNSWSAEYSLRITPLLNEQQEPVHAQAYIWTFPQAYYSVLFSLRALIFTRDQETVANESQLGTYAWILYSVGIYNNTDLPQDFYEELSKLRISSKNRTTGFSSDPIEIEAVHSDLVKRVDTIAEVHERVILDCIGAKQYRAIYHSLPDYLRDSFLTRRTLKILGA